MQLSLEPTPDQNNLTFLIAMLYNCLKVGGFWEVNVTITECKSKHVWNENQNF